MLTEAFAKGWQIKVGISNACVDLAPSHSDTLPHELFIHAGPGYYNTQQKFFTVESQPAVRVLPAVPMMYKSGGWDLEWYLLRTDGFVSYWQCDPLVANLKFKEEIIEETAETKLVRNGNGAILRWWKDKAGAPEHVDFAIQDRKDWEKAIRPYLTNKSEYRQRINFDNYRSVR